MNRAAMTAAALMASAAFLWTVDAAGWGSANRWGGSTSHSWGSTSHENRWGGSSSHEAGEGSEHTNAYGGSTSHAYDGGTEHTNMYGGSTSGAYGEGATHTYTSGATAYHPPGYPAYGGYPAYHPPVAVPYYSAGCYGCAAAAGAVAGIAVGATAASANAASAYSSGYDAGSAGVNTAPAPTVATAANYEMGVNYAALPPGSMTINKGGATYYLNGNTWFQPAYGANGVYYRVVPGP